MLHPPVQRPAPLPQGAPQWRKLGQIYAPTGEHSFSKSHAQVPIAWPLGDGRLRIYFGTRDDQGRTTTTFIEVDEANPKRVLYVHDRPALGLGALGTFDDRGAMPSCIIERGEALHLYYIGWNTSSSVSYRLSIGLAISTDDGRSFHRAYPGPILERSHLEPQWCAAPSVMEEGGLFRMWYLSCTEWREVDGHPEPRYHIKYAESDDGVLWKRDGRIAIDYASPDEAGIARPRVIKDGDRYRMWFSYRNFQGYRHDPSQSYRIGYAESCDGLKWERLDHLAGIDVSEAGWDSQMIEYPWVWAQGSELRMIYNGNGFGRAGFGLAILD